jgi:hypothetical protein
MPGYTNGDSLSIGHVQELTGMKLSRIDFSTKPSVEITWNHAPNIKYSFQAAVSPLLAIRDKEAEPLGKLGSTAHTVFARKKRKGHTSWYATLPLHEGPLFRAIMKEAGVHIYNENTSDVTFSGSGLLWIHSVEGGPRTIILKNGKKLELNLPAKSTTLYHNTTGEMIF